MSQVQINEMLKKMLDFGRGEKKDDVVVVENNEKIIDVDVSKKNVLEIDADFLNKRDEMKEMNEMNPKPTEKTPLLSRKQRRENQRKEERILKAKAKKNVSSEKPTLSQLKEIARKNAFEKEDRTRLERILFNK